jgi:4-aminobutyrate aminotransferase-like enzyme
MDLHSADAAGLSASEQIAARVRALEAPGMRSFADPSPFVIERAVGSRVTDADGREYIDLSGFHGVGNIGHAHPAVVEAITKQASDLIHCPTSYVSRVRAECYEAIASILPPSLNAILPQPSGALANEVAVLLARRHRPDGEIISFAGGYHGRTTSTASLAGKADYRYRLGVRAGAQFLPFPSPLLGEDSADTVLRTLDQLTGPGGGIEKVSAILVEAVQGNGGVVIPPDSFLKGLREFCDRTGALLIVDEIQAGFGRTGLMWAFERSGIVPDIVTIGKGIAGGMPLAAVVARREFVGWAPDTIAGTFLVNHLLLAAIPASVGVLVNEGLVERSRVLGEKYLVELKSHLVGLPGVRDVRGAGLWIAVELGDAAGKPASVAAKVARQLRADGILIGTGGYSANVVKLAPPLNIEEPDLEQGIRKMVQAVASYSASL